MSGDGRHADIERRETGVDQSKFCVVLVILVPTHCYVMGTGHQPMMIFYPYLGG